MIDLSAWCSFWIFMCVFIACDCWIFSTGRDSYLQTHKTDAEKEIQRLKIEKIRESKGDE